MDNLQREVEALQRVLDLADDITGGRLASLSWLSQPLSEFNGLTPEHLVLSGRIEELVDYVSSTTSQPISRT